jgi:bifunctional DNA-binding transcriptional regulator/antitoxin component of YhaV-PrlF toxin-antitoxin module
MSDTMILELDQSGLVALPQALRDRYHLQPGDSLTLLDLGGVFVLSPRRSEIDEIANQMKAEFVRQGETLESLLAAAREERDGITQ